MKHDPDEVLTLAEAAEEVRYSTRTMRRLVKDGLIEAARIGPGRTIRIRRRSLMQALPGLYRLVSGAKA